MKRFRFSIASLLILVLFVAVAVAALRASTDAWDISVFGLTLLMFLTSVLLAVHRTDLRRPYWLGFALFGWAYLVASLVPTVEERLPTTRWIAVLGWLLPPRTIDLTTNQDPAARSVFLEPDGSLKPEARLGVRSGSANLVASIVGPTKDFIRIGHSLLALVLAFAGGHLSRSLYGGGRGRRGSDPIVTS